MADEDELLKAHLKLIAKMARELRPNESDLEDLIQEGAIGFLQGLRRFDPTRGVPLATYAAWWIRAYQLRYLMANHRIVRLGTTVNQRKIFFRLRSAIARLEAAGIDPTDERLAARLGVRPREVRDMRGRLASREAVLPAGLVDAASRPDEAAARSEINGIVRQEADRFHTSLAGRDRALFEARYQTDEPATLSDMGRRLGVSRERARQLEQRLLGKLRVRLDRRLAAAG